ncbi:MAG: hypothetical protein HIU84_00295 [Acidobacteria bacterium]|nr:hypothetical protein [Acidobacteriota bacterium]
MTGSHWQFPIVKEVPLFATFFSVSAFISAVAVGVALPLLALQLEVRFRRNRRKTLSDTAASLTKDPT